MKLINNFIFGKWWWDKQYNVPPGVHNQKVMDNVEGKNQNIAKLTEVCKDGRAHLCICFGESELGSLRLIARTCKMDFADRNQMYRSTKISLQIETLSHRQNNSYRYKHQRTSLQNYSHRNKTLFSCAPVEWYRASVSFCKWNSITLTQSHWGKYEKIVDQLLLNLVAFPQASSLAFWLC